MTIDRIGTASSTQMMLSRIQKAEIAVDTANRQVSTGNVSDTYSGYGDKTAVMEIARSATEHADANIAAAQQAASRLDLQDTQLSQLSSIADQVRQTLTSGAANQDATALMNQMDGFFAQATEILNAKDSSGYIFGGDKNQTPPLTVSTLSDLAALPSVASAFANGNIKTTMRIGDTQTIQVGVLASDIGTQLMSLFQQVAQFNAGTPFSAATTPAQQTFLESTIQTATNATEGINQVSAVNGISYQMTQNTMTRLQATSSVYKSFVSNIQNVDMPTALSQLNQDQIALQASFQVTSTLNKLSLLNYLN